jgi:hypothetical protein
MSRRSALKMGTGSLVALLMSGSVALFSFAQAANAPRNVIISSWDGLDRLVVWELLAKQKLPNLAAIVREGSLQEIHVAGHRTETKPSHAEMLTGMGVQDTGVVSNEVYRPIPEGYTIFERLQRHLGGKEQVHTFMVVGGVAHVGGRGPAEVRQWMEEKRNQVALKKYGRSLPPGADDVGYQKEYQAEPFFITRSALDVFDGERRDVSVSGPLFLNYLDRFKTPRFVAFLHFSDPDHAMHIFGSDSQEYREAAIECDQWLGKIVEWLKREGLYDQTLMYVMTDHGADPHAYKHNNAPHSWLATNDPLVTQGGIIADVPATILARFGVEVDRIEPKLIGRPLTGPAEAHAVHTETDWPATPTLRNHRQASPVAAIYHRFLRYLGLDKVSNRGELERPCARVGWGWGGELARLPG